MFYDFLGFSRVFSLVLNFSFSLFLFYVVSIFLQGFLHVSCFSPKVFNVFLKFFGFGHSKNHFFKGL